MLNPFKRLFKKKEPTKTLVKFRGGGPLDGQEIFMELAWGYHLVHHNNEGVYTSKPWKGETVLGAYYSTDTSELGNIVSLEEAKQDQ